CVVALCEFLLLHFFFFMWRCLPLLSTLFPYTTLFRSCIRRFVRDQQVFIFVDNTKRNGSRGNRVGALFREKNGQKVSRFWFLIGVCPGVVQADTVDRAFQMGEDVMGISPVSQVLFDGLLFVTWLDGIFKNSFHMCSFLRVLPGISRSGSNGVFRRKQ